MMHWPGELRRLPGRLVVALDLPGHGRSAGTNSPSFDRTCTGQDIVGYARVVGRFAQELGLDTFALAGHSMGGAVAQEFALRYPQRLAGMILVATGAKLPVAPDLLRTIQEDFRGAAEAMTAWSQGKRSDPSTMRIYLQRLCEVDPQLLYSDYAACNAWDRTADVGNITVPTLVICGDADRMTPLRYSLDLAQQIATARLVVVPGAGHMVMLEQPAVVTEAVVHFLDGLARA
jgi:pimeloyl-ACP methyl ester carboxylesterase